MNKPRKVRAWVVEKNGLFWNDLEGEWGGLYYATLRPSMAGALAIIKFKVQDAEHAHPAQVIMELT